MSLLTQQTTQAPGQYFFAQKTTSGVVSEPGYVATGVNATPYVAQRVQDVGFGLDSALVIQNNTPTTRWSVGLVNVEGGANGGSDLAFASYNDAGAIIATPVVIDRSSGETTCGGVLSSVADAAGGSIVRAISTDDADNVALIQALAGTSALTTRAAAGGSAVQLRRTVAGGTGFASETCTDTTGATATAFTVALDTGLSTKPVGQVNFTIDPKINNQPFCIPWFSQQAFPGNFVGAGSQTITVGIPAPAIGKQQILLHWNHYGIQDDTGNALSMTCSVQSNNGVGPAQGGSPLSAYSSSGDQVCAGSTMVLNRGADYDNNTATLLFVFTVTSGNFKGGRFALSAFAMS